MPEQPFLVVQEPGRRWIDHVRSRLRGLPVHVHHSTREPDSLKILAGQQRSTLLLELGSRPLAALDLLETVCALDRDALAVVLAAPGQAGMEVWARELGAAAFLRQPIPPHIVAGVLEQMVRSRMGGSLMAAAELDEWASAMHCGIWGWDRWGLASSLGPEWVPEARGV